MRRIFNNILIGFGLAVFCAYPAMADDTEIFVGNLLAGANSNVLLILDTSGSMSGMVSTAPLYDPEFQYEGDCDTGVLYWASGSNTPSCDNDNWFNTSAFYCNGVRNALATYGKATDRMAQWVPDESDSSDSRWRSFNSDRKDNYVECRVDNGLHGDGIDAAEVYAADGSSGPWSSRDKSRIDWRDENLYTVATGNYMNYQNIISQTEYESLTRLELMKRAVTDIMNNTSNINVGLMRFSRNGDGGQILVPVGPLSSTREDIITTVAGLDHGGTTPLAETMFESARYYAGMTPYYGLTATGNDSVAQPSHADSIASGRYVSPIVNQCQRNFTVMLTDGEPVSDTGANASIKDLTGFEDATGSDTCSGNCLDELAAYMQNRDINAELPGDQIVDTYTIGLFTDQQLLEDTAQRGGGEYYTATSATELAQAFEDIFEEIEREHVTFNPPSVAVNAFNRLTHRDELYFTMFQPDASVRWPGNLKRYRLGLNDGDRAILDATDRPAVNPETGVISVDSKSFWTIGDPDGAHTTAGGFASRLLANRRVFTVTGSDMSNVVLSDAANRVHEDNTALTAALLTADDDAERLEIIRWARGVDAEGNALNLLGDALHANPVVATYGGTAEDPDLSLFYTTNDGYFHAVDASADANESLEIFSFIPQDQLARVKAVAENAGSGSRTYGLDGPMTFWHKNDDGDGIVETGNSERYFVYFGQRRGGRHYYSLDLTNRATPKLKWVLEGGTGEYAELGQTWSAMTPARIKMNGIAREVLIFGGGYDTDQDAAGASSEDSMGRAVYMAYKDNGRRVWWAANAADHPGANLPLADMTHSIPSELRVIDINGDGYHDRIYVGDTGGKVWRFDIDNEGSTGANSLVTGGVIADLGGEGAANNRRFYYPPSVSEVVSEDLGTFLAVSIGSGHRANPLGTPGSLVDDRFYMIRDPYRYAPPPPADGETTPSYTTATEEDLIDVTQNLSPTTAQLNGHKGWMIRMDENEKVMSAALTADGRIFFTSYVPGSNAEPSCNPSGAIGSGRLYAVAIASGSPHLTDDPWEPRDPDDPEPPEGEPDCQYRCEDTPGPIPPSPVLIFQDPNEDAADPCTGLADAVMVVGTELYNPDICTAPVRTYWLAEDGT